MGQQKPMKKCPDAPCSLFRNSGAQIAGLALHTMPDDAEPREDAVVFTNVGGKLAVDGLEQLKIQERYRTPRYRR